MKMWEIVDGLTSGQRCAISGVRPIWPPPCFEMYQNKGGANRKNGGSAPSAPKCTNNKGGAKSQRGGPNRSNSTDYIEFMIKINDFT